MPRDGARRRRYSAALCRGLIEATTYSYSVLPTSAYSAALCRGLIEALLAPPRASP